MAWTVNLSNGETLIEETTIAKDKSPWQKLLSYCKTNKLEPRGIFLRVGNIQVFGLPYKICDGYFHAYEARRMLFRPNETSLSQGVGSVVGDKVYITWVDLKPVNGIYQVNQDIRLLSEVRVHTLMK